MSLNVLFEDENILVINKPSNCVVNISQTSSENTLQHMIIDYLHLQFPPKNGASDYSDFVKRSGIVHRLDKDTSGVLLVAKNEETFTKLQAQFKSRKVKKEYIALVFGKIMDDKIHIDAPIARHPKQRTRFAISRSGKQSITDIVKLNEKLVDDVWLSLVSVYPVTGRTHQIRVHLLAIEHPVVTDVIYSGRGRTKWALLHGFNRLMLHSHKIGIQYPGEDYSWFEATIPDEFHDFI